MGQRWRRWCERIGRVRREIGRAILGQAEVVDQALITLFSGGQCCWSVCRASARASSWRRWAMFSGLAAKRMQFSADLMPGDIIGSEVLDEGGTGGEASGSCPARCSASC